MTSENSDGEIYHQFSINGYMYVLKKKNVFFATEKLENSCDDTIESAILGKFR